MQAMPYAAFDTESSKSDDLMGSVLSGSGVAVVS